MVGGEGGVLTSNSRRWNASEVGGERILYTSKSSPPKVNSVESFVVPTTEHPTMISLHDNIYIYIYILIMHHSPASRVFTTTSTFPKFHTKLGSLFGPLEIEKCSNISLNTLGPTRSSDCRLDAEGGGRVTWNIVPASKRSLCVFTTPVWW